VWDPGSNLLLNSFLAALDINLSSESHGGIAFWPISLLLSVGSIQLFLDSIIPPRYNDSGTAIIMNP